MLDLLARVDPIEVVERRGLPIKHAVAHHEHEVALAQNLVQRGDLEDVLWLQAGWGVCAVAIVLVKQVLSLVFRRLRTLPAQNHVAEVPVHQRLVCVGLVEIEHLRRSVELSSSAHIRSRTLDLRVVPMLDDLPALESKHVEYQHVAREAVYALSEVDVAIRRGAHDSLVDSSPRFHSPYERAVRSGPLCVPHRLCRGESTR